LHTAQTPVVVENGLSAANTLPATHKGNSYGRHPALDLAAGALWRMPGRFGIARVLGLSYSLRCVVFHDVSATESPFTRGMRVTIPPSDFEAALKFLTRYYTPVRLQDVLDASEGRNLPPRPVLVTFDDGYASTMECAAPICRKYAVPGVLFLNAAFLDNEELAPDNLVCYLANLHGMEAINAAVRAVGCTDIPRLESLAEIFSRFFPSISLAERRAFLDALAHLGGISQRQLAKEAGLYLTRQQVSEMAASVFEIGNHTYNHVHCRSLTPADFGQEIGRNKAELEALSGKKVRSFSLPYGSSVDLTNDMLRNLRLSGHEAVFLSESVANLRAVEYLRFDRVSIHANKDDAFFFEIEVLPRLRAVRNRLLRGLEFVRTARKDAFSSRWGGTTCG
jgi:peptidoglycan/xylan/chitin deacetylase (PgdA/CDA1 family)